MLIAPTLVAIAGSTLGQVTDESAAAQAELRADAASRSSLLEGRGLLAQNGPSVDVGGMLQFRYTANVRDTADGSTEESFTHGFSLPRARLTVGADLNETWSVFLQGNFDVDGGAFTLLDAWADWELDENWTLRGGQFKVPSSREWQANEYDGLAADRSVFNDVFSAGRTQGLAAIYTSDQFVFIGSFNTGANSLNSDFNGANNADYAFTGRVDWQFAGDRSQLDTFTGWQGQEFAGLLGGFAHYQDGGNTGVGNTGTTADVQLFEGLIDCQVEGNGWNAYGAAVYQYVNAAGADSMNNFGVLVQGGYMVAEADEIRGLAAALRSPARARDPAPRRRAPHAARSAGPALQGAARKVAKASWTLKTRTIPWAERASRSMEPAGHPQAAALLAPRPAPASSRLRSPRDCGGRRYAHRVQSRTASGLVAPVARPSPSRSGTHARRRARGR